jgi:hypothetical protein
MFTGEDGFGSYLTTSPGGKQIIHETMAKPAKKCIFLSFLAKRDSCEVNLKYGLVENRL